MLEYIHDVPRMIEFLSNVSASTILASYAPLRQDTLKNRSWRLAQGWVNAFSEEQFTDLFEQRGWTCLEVKPWKNQLIYRFEHTKQIGAQQLKPSR